MYEFSALLVFVATAAVAGVVLSWLQEVFKGAAWVQRLNQRFVAVLLAVLAGAGAYIVEFQLGYDLFVDINAPQDIVALIVAMWFGGQAAYNHLFRR